MEYSHERYKCIRKKHTARGHRTYYLELFGNFLAEREGYKQLDGMDAIHFYLVQKFRWMPKDVRAMNYDDISLLLSQEMADWTAPVESRFE
jgi:hypothetical protein